MAMGDAPLMPADPEAVLRSRRARLLLVVAIAFGLLVASSTLTAVSGRPRSPSTGHVAYLLGLEAISLAVLWRVLEDHPAGWQGLRLADRWTALPISLGLAVGGWLAFYFVYVLLAVLAVALTGHPYRPIRPVTVLDLGLNAWTLALVLVNPFFEEWIVRGFVIREVDALTGAAWKAVAASVLLQVAYHTYQGPLPALSLAANFLVWSVYYARTRRILPVILAHLYLDLFALLSRAHFH
jgi:membrane protease YdiL (CAAX protease family)